MQTVQLLSLFVMLQHAAKVGQAEQVPRLLCYAEQGAESSVSRLCTRLETNCLNSDLQFSCKVIVDSQLNVVESGVLVASVKQ